MYYFTNMLKMNEVCMLGVEFLPDIRDKNKIFINIIRLKILISLV